MASKKPPRATGKDGKIDWVKQLRFNMEFAKRQLLSDGYVRPIFCIMSPTGLIVVGVDMQPDAKPRTRSLINLMCYAHDAIGFIMISEAWMKRADDFRPGESLAEYEQRSVLPRDSERRIEVVIVQAVYYDADGERQSAMLTREVMRDPSGKPSGLALVEQMDDDGKQGQSLGPSVEILPEHRPTPAQRQKAQQVLAMLQQTGAFDDLPVTGSA